ncbi:MAG: hypothetical protein K1X89_14475 [Myxococcaceae bacterium]|nr:hypothetical protein [Myxococcaceae bacterium]
MRTAALAVLVPALAFAKPGGITGFVGNNPASDCSSCHAKGAATPTVSFSGPSSLAPGASGSFTLTVKGGPGSEAGIDVGLLGTGASSGTFTAGPGTKVLGGELVQSAPKAFADGGVTFAFTLKAPSTAGAYTLSASALSSDGDGSLAGDGTGTASFALTVTGGSAVDAGTPAPVVDAGTPAASTPSGTGSGTTVAVAPKPAPPPPPTAKNPYDGVGGVEEVGCSASPGIPALALALAALLRRGVRRA